MADWTKEDIKRLRTAAREKQTLPQLAKTLRRSEAAIEGKARREGIRLTPQRAPAKKAAARKPVAGGAKPARNAA